MIVVTPQTASAEELIDRACQAVEVEALKKRILIRKPEGERIFCKFGYGVDAGSGEEYSGECAKVFAGRFGSAYRDCSKRSLHLHQDSG